MLNYTFEKLKALSFEDENGCWIWTRSLSQGYSQVHPGVRGHRAMYEVCYGDIPKGLVIEHLCSNKKCINPEHLKLSTQRENIHRTAKKLTNKDAKYIRESSESGRTLSKKFNVSDSMISRIRSGKRW